MWQATHVDSVCSVGYPMKMVPWYVSSIINASSNVWHDVHPRWSAFR